MVGPKDVMKLMLIAHCFLTLYLYQQVLCGDDLIHNTPKKVDHRRQL